MINKLDETNKIFFLLDSNNNKNLKIINKFIEEFPKIKIELYFWSESNQKFYFGENLVDIEDRILFADSVVNLLSKKSESYRKIGQKLEKLKLLKWQNSIATNLLFSQKSNIKRLFKQFNLSSPFFEKIKEKTPNKLFSNFSQPSRIFSKKNDFFSRKLENVKQINEVFQEQKLNIRSYFIEEYIEGDDYYFLIIKDNKKDNIKIFFISEISDDINISRELEKIVEDAFNKFGIEKYAIFHFKISKNKKIYFLNVFTEIDILINNITKKIFKKYNLSFKKIITILD